LQRWGGEVVVCKRLEGGGFTVEKKRKLHKITFINGKI
jgi:hypothetical protein